MKLRHLIIIGLFVLINGLVIYALANAKPKPPKEKDEKSYVTYLQAKKVENREEDLMVGGYGTLSSYNNVDIPSEVQGKLISGKALKPGIKFKKGDLLFHIDDVEAKYNLRARKSNFIILLANIMPDLKMDYNS